MSTKIITVFAITTKTTQGLTQVKHKDKVGEAVAAWEIDRAVGTCSAREAEMEGEEPRLKT
jgi:hypothetical protein